MQIYSSHTHPENSATGIMHKILYALIPGIILSTYYFGIGILINCLLAVAFALIFEALVLILRKKTIRPVITDGTAIITLEECD